MLKLALVVVGLGNQHFSPSWIQRLNVYPGGGADQLIGPRTSIVNGGRPEDDALKALICVCSSMVEPLASNQTMPVRSGSHALSPVDGDL